MVVVIVAPSLDQPAGLAERAEQRLVQQLVPEPGVEALRECVLHRLAGLDIAPRDAPLVRPREDRSSRSAPCRSTSGTCSTEALTDLWRIIRRQAVRAGPQISKVKVSNPHFGEARP